jgi:hypothetical protein
VLRYNPEIGRWTNLISRRRAKAGSEAGCVIWDFRRQRPEGRCVVWVDGVRYPSSRLAWFYMTGQWPKNQIDHKNLDTLDDRWLNLREATLQQNLRNTRRHKDSTTGFKGVRKQRGRYRAWIWAGKRFYGGTFDTRRGERGVQALGDQASR